MPSYAVSVRSKGQVQTIELSAANTEMAQRQARRHGTVLKVTRARQKSSGGGMSAGERYTFLVRLATMLASKVGVAEALRLLRDTFGGNISRASAKLLEKVELGTDLPTAISDDTKNFPGAIGLIIKVGAQTGQTYKALQEAAEFERKINEIKNSSGRGIMGAVLAFIIAGILMVVSTMYIGPQIMEMGIVQAAGDAVDLTMVNLIAFWSGAIMIALLVVFAVLFWLATVGRFLFPVTADRIIMSVPYYNELVLAQENYIGLHRLGLLVRAGVRLEECLKASWDATKPGLLKEDYKRCLEYVRQGKKWAQGMSMLHPTVRAALMLASDRDQIATNISNIAAQIQSLYLQRLSTLAPVLQVSAALAVSLAGMVLFGQSILPMLQVSAGLLEQ